MVVGVHYELRVGVVFALYLTYLTQPRPRVRIRVPVGTLVPIARVLAGACRGGGFVCAYACV